MNILAKVSKRFFKTLPLTEAEQEAADRKKFETEQKRLGDSRFHKHEWKVQWNDDDACACGVWKRWPSGILVRN